MDAHDRRGRADRGRPQARGRACGRARRERGGRGGDARRLRAHRGSHGHGARRRGGHGVPQPEAAGGDLRGARHGRAHRTCPDAARGAPRRALRTRARAVRRPRPAAERAARARRAAARHGRGPRRVNLQRCLERLDEAVADGASLGIATAEAARVAETARARLRFPGEAYVLALAGGTGVGKSTVLNALAGEEVSPAGARRPTTAEPVAWVPADKRAELAQLLEWLGVTQVREHHADGLGELAVLDLPDFDSVAVEHRARVDALLPKVAADARVAVGELARRGGIADGQAAPLVDPARRERATREVSRAVLALVDIAGLERQAVAATRLAARPRGAGPLGHLTSALYRLTGRARASADPAGYLRRWRMRGSLAPAIEPVRDLLASALPSVPVALRSAVASLAAPADAERRLADAVDRALTAEASELHTPTSFIWSLIGFGQYLVTGLLVFGALWLAALFVLHDAPSGSVNLPYLGPVPNPVVFIAAVLLAGYLLALALRYHAGWLGRRWARRIGALVAREVQGRVGDTILSPLDVLDAGREHLAAAARGIEDDCA